MKEIIKNELVLKISGSVVSSNMEVFELLAKKTIDQIKTDLKTDSDFAAAERNIKDCSVVENMVSKAREDALNETSEIAKLIEATNRVEGMFRDKRLFLGKKVKSEKQKRKLEVINGARKKLSDFINDSSVKDHFSLNNIAIEQATKNKKTIVSMKKAVNAVVAAEKEKLEEFEEEFKANLALITEAEKEFPGIFADKNSIAALSKELVESEIKARIAQFRLDTKLKEEKEKAVEPPQETVIENKTLPPENKKTPSGYVKTSKPEKQKTEEIVVVIDVSKLDNVLSSLYAIDGVISIK